MAYHVSLADGEGKQRYRVVIVDELDQGTARHLADWLDAAQLNPGAQFELDLSEARWVDERALQRLLRRHGELASDRRLAVTGDRAAAARFAVAVPAVLALQPLVSACV